MTLVTVYHGFGPLGTHFNWVVWIRKANAWDLAKMPLGKIVFKGHWRGPTWIRLIVNMLGMMYVHVDPKHLVHMIIPQPMVHAIMHHARFNAPLVVGWSCAPGAELYHVCPSSLSPPSARDQIHESGWLPGAVCIALQIQSSTFLKHILLFFGQALKCAVPLHFHNIWFAISYSSLYS